jgi:hypothetical protein
MPREFVVTVQMAEFRMNEDQALRVTFASCSSPILQGAPQEAGEIR